MRLNPIVDLNLLVQDLSGLKLDAEIASRLQAPVTATAYIPEIIFYTFNISGDLIPN